jgi:hypothetical protein
MKKPHVSGLRGFLLFLYCAVRFFELISIGAGDGRLRRLRYLLVHTALNESESLCIGAFCSYFAPMEFIIYRTRKHFGLASMCLVVIVPFGCIAPMSSLDAHYTDSDCLDL